MSDNLLGGMIGVDSPTPITPAPQPKTRKRREAPVYHAPSSVSTHRNPPGPDRVEIMLCDVPDGIWYEYNHGPDTYFIARKIKDEIAQVPVWVRKRHLDKWLSE
jgi:hypothetical protein